MPSHDNLKGGRKKEKGVGKVKHKMMMHQNNNFLENMNIACLRPLIQETMMIFKYVEKSKDNTF